MSIADSGCAVSDAVAGGTVRASIATASTMMGTIATYMSAKITLNGIAQGYATDRVTDLLRAAGCEHTLVDMGEIRCIGDHPAHRPWDVALRDPRDGSRSLGSVLLSDMSIATSSGLGTPFDATGRFNHIFEPSKGTCASRYLSVSVKTARATTADALSTAFSLMPTPAAARVLAASGGGEAFFAGWDRQMTNIRAT